MIRRADTGPGEPVTTWEAAQQWAALLGFAAVLAYETHGWPPGTSMIRRAFWWTRDDVPAEFRRDHAPDRPDPRPVLTGDPGTLAEHAAAMAAWNQRNREWHRRRLEWLGRAAGHE